LSLIGTSIEFFTIGVDHDTSPTPLVGASCTGSDCRREFAFAIEIACFTAFAIASALMSLVAAKPHVPLAMTRMPTPEDSVLTTFCTLSSRVITNWRRYLPMRTSQYVAPPDFAAASATSASFFLVAASIFVSSTSAATWRP